MSEPMFYYENLWKHLVRDAGGIGEASRIDAGGEPLQRQHLESVFEWVAHKNGSVGGYTLVYNPVFLESVDELLDSRYWTGDSGTFDTGDVGGLEEFEGVVRLRPDDTLYAECIVLVVLESVSLTGEVEYFEHNRQGGTTAHSYAVVTGIQSPEDES